VALEWPGLAGTHQKKGEEMCSAGRKKLNEETK